MTATPKPFTLDVDPETLDWVNNRVKTSRIIPDLAHPKGSEWQHGTPSAVMEDLIQFWKNSYDWRKVEREINATFKMFTLEIEEAGETIDLHFVHHKSTRENAIPLLYAHGWPGNFLEAESLLTLTEPKDPKAQAFHIIAPSLPGFTFSSEPKTPGFTLANTARVYYKLMRVLGYTHWTICAGDWGSFVCRSMAVQYPEAVVGLHLTFVLSLAPSPLKNPLTLLWLIVRWFSPAEKVKLGRMQHWMKSESGYSRIQGTKPQSIGYGLNDSPLGMLAWIREKLEAIIDPAAYSWSPETCITWTMLYLLSNNAGHARIYRENIPKAAEEVVGQKIPGIVSVGVSSFPMDVMYIPEWWARATLAESIRFWKDHDKGGHFPSIECPDALKEDIYEFVGRIPKERLALCYTS